MGNCCDSQNNDTGVITDRGKSIKQSKEKKQSKKWKQELEKMNAMSDEERLQYIIDKLRMPRAKQIEKKLSDDKDKLVQDTVTRTFTSLEKSEDDARVVFKDLEDLFTESHAARLVAYHGILAAMDKLHHITDIMESKDEDIKEMDIAGHIAAENDYQREIMEQTKLPPLEFNNRTLPKRMPFKDCWKGAPFCPINYEQLKKFMKDAKDDGQPIRGMGSQYAFNNITNTKGLLLNTQQYLCNPKLQEDMDIDIPLLNKRGESINEDGNYIISQVGATPQIVHNVTWPNELSNNRFETHDPVTKKPFKMLQYVGGYIQLSLGGLISVGAAGNGGISPAIANQVLSFRMLTFDENHNLKVYQIEKGGDKSIHDKNKWDAYYNKQKDDDKIELIQNDDVFNAAISSVGSMGVIYSFTIELTDAFNLSKEKLLCKWSEFKKYYWELVKLQEKRVLFKMEYYLSPYGVYLNGEGDSWICLSIFIKTKDPVKEKPTIDNAGSAWGKQSTVILGTVAVVWLSHYFPYALGIGLYGALYTQVHKPLVMSAIDAYNFGAPNAAPVKTGGQVVNAETILDALEEFISVSRETNGVLSLWQLKYPCTSPNGVRLCENGDGIISMGAGKSTAFIELPCPNLYETQNKKILKIADSFLGKGATRNWENSFNEIYKNIQKEPYYGRYHLAFYHPDWSEDQWIAYWTNKNYYPDFEKYLDVYKKFNVTKTFTNEFTRSTGLDKLAGFK